MNKNLNSNIFNLTKCLDQNAWQLAVNYANNFLTTPENTQIENIAPADDSIEKDYQKLSPWRAQQIPDVDFTPDYSIKLDGVVVKEYIQSAFPTHFEIGGGKLDATAAYPATASLGCKKNESCEWTQHLLNINLVSMGEKSRRILIQWNGQVIPLDSIGLSIVPTPRIKDGVIYLDFSVEIDWVRDKDWPAWVLIAANEYVRSTVNPNLPRPILSVPMQNIEIPANSGIQKSAFRIEGCPYSTSGTVEQKVCIDLKMVL